MNGNTKMTQEDVPASLLIADDDEDVLELVRLGLMGNDCEILTAGDGVTALATARDRKPLVA